MAAPLQEQPRKKGLGPLAWVAIGCVGLIVLTGVGLTVGGYYVKGKVKGFVERAEQNPELVIIETMARLNPEIDLVGTDEARRTVTIRNKNTGEEVTLDFEDAREGTFRFSTGDEQAEIRLSGDQGVMEVTSKEGTVRWGGGGEVPAWVPIYPGTQAQVAFSSDDASSTSGIASLETADSLDRVLGYFRQQLEAAGYEVSESRFSGPDGEGALVAGENKRQKHSLQVALEGTTGGTRATLTYQASK
jgi:hypothetical protein